MTFPRGAPTGSQCPKSHAHGMGGTVVGQRKFSRRCSAAPCHRAPDDRPPAGLSVQYIAGSAREVRVAVVARADRTERGEPIFCVLVAPPNLRVSLLLLLTVAATAREGHCGKTRFCDFETAAVA